MKVMAIRYASARGMRTWLAGSVIVVSLAFSACNGGGAPIERGRFIGLYSRILVMGERYRGDSTATRHAVDSVLAHERVKRTDLESTMQWYADRPAELDSLLRDIDRHLAPPEATAPARRGTSDSSTTSAHPAQARP